MLETGMGGVTSPKTGGGGENFELAGVAGFDPFLQRFYRKSSIWGSKVPPPSSGRYILTPPPPGLRGSNGGCLGRGWFTPISGRGPWEAETYFFSNFGPEARNPFCSRPTGSQAQCAHHDEASCSAPDPNSETRALRLVWVGFLHVKKAKRPKRLTLTIPKRKFATDLILRKAKPGGFQPGCFPLFSGKVQIVSRTLSGLFLVGALNRPRKRKRDKSGKSPDHPRANQENPRKTGKVPKRTKKEGRVQIGKHPRLKPPCLAALDLIALFFFFRFLQVIALSPLKLPYHTRCLPPWEKYSREAAFWMVPHCRMGIAEIVPSWPKVLQNNSLEQLFL